MKQLFTAALLVLGLVACSPEAPAPEETVPVEQEPTSTEDEQTGDTLTVYAPHSRQAYEALYAAFEDKAGIRVKVIEGDEASLADRLANQAAADVILATDVATLDQLKSASLIQTLATQNLTPIPKNLRDPDGYWTGFAKHYRVIVYDPQVVSESEVDTYADLADPRLQGEVCVSAASDLHNLSLLGEMIAREGSDIATLWANGVVANLARPPGGNGIAQIEAVAAGECAVALINHHDWFHLANGTPENRLKAAKTELSFPDQDGQGVHMNMFAGALSADPALPEQATRFLEFLASPEGQELLTATSGDFPVAVRVRVPTDLEHFSNFQESDFPLPSRDRHQAEARAILAAAGWN